MNVEIVYDDFTHTVEGLDEIVSCDIADQCEITFKGKNGSGFASGRIWNAARNSACEAGGLNGELLRTRMVDPHYLL